MKIDFKLSQVAKSVVLATDASATIDTSSGNAMRFCGVVVSRTGRPFEVLTIGDDWQKVLGKPYHTRQGVAAESIRHVQEALVGGKGYLVRVVPSTAKYPIITVRDVVANEDTDNATYNTHGTVTAIEGDAEHESVTTALPYGTEISQNDSADIVSFYLIDGDNEHERFIKLEDLDVEEYGEGFKLLTLFEKQDDIVSELEQHIVSASAEARDVNNAPAFIADKLDANSQRVRCEVNMEKIADLFSFEKLTFSGGTSGSLKDITSADYVKAVDILSNADPDHQAVCALGCYDDEALKRLAKYAEDCRVSLYYDIEPNLSYADALARQAALPISNHHACAYHLPYRCNDPFYGNVVSYGLSGFVFSAKARGVASTAPVGAWHKVPAGMDRATITRSGMVLNENAGTPDYAEMVKARINKIGLNSQGKPMIDDHLTCRAKSDDLRYEGVVSGDNFLQREWYKLTQQWKHEPIKDALDGLQKGFLAVLRDAETAGVLTKTTSGGDAYNLVITQEAKDLLVAVWHANIQGSMRRSTGQCVLKAFDGE